MSSIVSLHIFVLKLLVLKYCRITIYDKCMINEEFIKSCDKSLDKICCGYCIKYFNFDKIKLHKYRETTI